MLTVSIAGKPEPSGSKTKGRWGGIRDSNPSASDYRKIVANEVSRAMEARGLRLVPKPIPVVLDVVFYRVRPSSHFRKDGTLSAEGERNLYPTTKPDRGKLLRTIEDALTGTLYQDDAQVVAGRVRKAWGDRARAELTIHTWDPEWERALYRGTLGESHPSEGIHPPIPPRPYESDRMP